MVGRGRIAIAIARQHAACFEFLTNDRMRPRTRYAASPSHRWCGITIAPWRRGPPPPGTLKPENHPVFLIRTRDFLGSLNFPDQIDVV